MGTMSNFEAMVTKKHDLELKEKKEKMIQGVVSKMQKKLAEPEPKLLVDDLDGDISDSEDFVDMALTPSMGSTAAAEIPPKGWLGKNASVREEDSTDSGKATELDDAPVRLEPVHAPSVDPVPKASELPRN